MNAPPPNHGTSCSSLRPDPLIVAFTGLAGSGKDASADHLCDRFGFVRASFAESLKTMAAQLLDDANVDYSNLFEHALKDKPMAALHDVSGRQIMQTLGDWGRGLHADWWISILERRLGLDGRPCSAPVHDRIVITDVRMPNEAAWVLRHHGLLLRLQRDQAAPVRQHDSEGHVRRLPASLEIANHGPTLVGLHAQLDAVMRALGVAEAERVEVWG